MGRCEKKIREFFARADINIVKQGARDFDIQIRNNRFFKRVYTHGSLGLGKSYMDGWWDCNKLDKFFFRVIKSELTGSLHMILLLIELAVRSIPQLVKSYVFNAARRKPFQIGNVHYNLWNKLFEKMLGPSMAYSCGYWRETKNLDDAQTAKYDLICKKLHLKNGMKVADIECRVGRSLQTHRV